MKTDLNTLLTGLYVWIDDYLGPQRRVGRPPRLTDAELLTLAVAQALLGVRSEARWLRLIPARLPGAFPYLPGQSGCAWRHLPRSSAWRRLSAPASSRTSSLMDSSRG